MFIKEIFHKGILMSNKYTLRDQCSLAHRFNRFVAEAKIKHGDIYDYSLTEQDYKNTRSRVRIECKLCGLVFKTLPQDHTAKNPNRKGGCPNCVKKAKEPKGILMRWNNNHTDRINHYRDMAESKHNKVYRYPYLEQEYKNENSILTVHCTKCENMFQSRARIHSSALRYGGCTSCNEDKMRMMISEKNRERQLHNYENKDVPVPVGYIYQLTNTINGQTYIGFTTMSLNGRFKAHKDSAAQIKKASYKSKSYIHQAIRKYGIDAFEIKALLTLNDVTPIQLGEYESHYIKQLKPHYNQTQGGDIWGPTSTAAKPVNAYDLDGKLIGSYRSLSYAAKMVSGTTPSGIALACKHNTLYRNMRWELSQNDIKTKDDYLSH